MATAAPEIPVLARDQAFESLYRQYVKDVYHYALALLRNPADAEDVTQTTFLNAYRAYIRGVEVEKPQNWLIKIAHNVARTRYARATRRVKEVPLEEHVELIAVPEEDRPDVQGVLRRARTIAVQPTLRARHARARRSHLRRDRRHDRGLGLRGRDFDLPGPSVFATQGVRAPIACRGAAADIACAVLRHGRCRRGRRRGRGRWTAPEGGGRDRRRRSRHRHRQRSQRSRLRGTFLDSPDRRPFVAGCRRLPDARGSRRERLERRPSPGSKDRATRGERDWDRFSARRRAGR